MFQFILFIHCALCLTLIFLVLVQQGKGADMGATFGGGGNNTVFGAGGATDLITKMTTGLAIGFMVTSILLVRAYSGYFETATAKPADPLSGSIVSDMEANTVEAPAAGALEVDVVEPSAPAEAVAGPEIGDAPAEPAAAPAEAAEPAVEPPAAGEQGVEAESAPQDQ